MCGGHTKIHNTGGLLLVSISVGPCAEFGEGDSLGLVMLSLKESEGGKVEQSCEPLEFNSKPAKHYFCCRALTYDVELIT